MRRMPSVRATSVLLRPRLALDLAQHGEVQVYLSCAHCGSSVRASLSS